MICNVRVIGICLVHLLSWKHLYCYAAGSAVTVLLDAASASTATEFCSSTTINYITHGLPQQCVKTGFLDPNSVATIAESNSIRSDGPELIPTVVKASCALPILSTFAQEETLKSGIISTNPSAKHVVQQNTRTVAAYSFPASVDNVVSLPYYEYEGESELDNAKFLSFEDWKRQNLAQAGQSSDALKQGRVVKGSGQGHSRHISAHEALDSLGEDAEIDLQFSGFGQHPKPHPGIHGTTEHTLSQSSDGSAESSSTTPHSRSRDAGKTCKERFNYASFDCAANVLKTNPQARSSSSVLVENKDSYMLNNCAAENKFLIIELCDDILIDTVVLANFEFFSSMFRSFRVSVSDRYPVKIDRWKELGTYEARNSRDVQAFLVENPLIWARYMRIEFLTHYGSEYYCPVSLLRVHGTTMMAEFRHQEELARGESDADDDAEEVTTNSVKPTNTEMPDLMDVPAPRSAEQAGSTMRQSIALKSLFEMTHTGQQEEAHSGAIVISTTTETYTQPTKVTDHCPATESARLLLKHVFPDTCAVQQARPPDVRNQHFKISDSSHAMSYSYDSTSPPTVSTGFESIPTIHVAIETDAPTTPLARVHHSKSAILVTSLTSNETISSALSASVTSTSPSSSMTSHSNPPATQESFFKSIHKRLQALEGNSSLSLQYIESQSQLLRDAFAKVEKRNGAKTSAFLDALNATVLAELIKFKDEYEKLWQGTVLELASQRAEGVTERQVLVDRIKVLADEVVSQKRFMAMQAVLLLLCLGVVIFTRVGGSGADATLLHGAYDTMSSTRRRVASSSRWRWDSPWASPVRSREGSISRTPEREASRPRLSSNGKSNEVEDAEEYPDDAYKHTGELDLHTPPSSDLDDDGLLQ